MPKVTPAMRARNLSSSCNCMLPHISIGASENRLAGSRFAAIDALALDTALRLVTGNDAQGSLRFLFDRQFRRAILGPFYAHAAALLRDDLFQFLLAARSV